MSGTVGWAVLLHGPEMHELLGPYNVRDARRVGAAETVDRKGEGVAVMVVRLVRTSASTDQEDQA